LYVISYRTGDHWDTEALAHASVKDRRCVNEIGFEFFGESNQPSDVLHVANTRQNPVYWAGEVGIERIDGVDFISTTRSIGNDGHLKASSEQASDQINSMGLHAPYSRREFSQYQ
tara:strand:- start:2053 stop:2397 length:345 start_codon:yes stop_codon:yes gene_type:complete